MKMNANTKAALLYLLPVVAVFGIWYALLFDARSPGATPEYVFMSVLTEGPRLLWFRWLLVLPGLCLVLAVAYLSRLSSSRIGATALLALGATLAGAAWLTVASEIALFVSLPLVYGFVVAKKQMVPK